MAGYLPQMRSKCSQIEATSGSVHQLIQFNLIIEASDRGSNILRYSSEANSKNSQNSLVPCLGYHLGHHLLDQRRFNHGSTTSAGWPEIPPNRDKRGRYPSDR